MIEGMQKSTVATRVAALTIVKPATHADVFILIDKRSRTAPIHRGAYPISPRGHASGRACAALLAG